MSQARVLGLIGVAAVAALAVAYAQTTVTPVPDNAPVEAAPLDAAAQVTWGDPKAGQSKAAACAACHGVDGNPADPQYPRLAGMPERYIAHQLALFKSNERTSGMAAVMKPFADPLSPQDMRDLGAYFAQQTAGAGVADDTAIQQGPYAGMKYYEVGQRLFVGGDAARGIPACMACHGPDGSGNPGPAYPSLAGQQAPYVQRRLEEYRAGQTTRRDPALFNIMASVAKQLTDEEIGALASYLQGLHDRARDVAAAGTPAAAP
ncbi:MAG TPA: c-type cytochrome, partial [Lysobacter sp.]|nr:c-type cytochrome [Lysobacter sp.]